MKPTSCLCTARKIALAAASLVCATSTALAGVADRESILQEAHNYSGAISINPASFFPSTSNLGALTLDNVYSFDYASAGIGTLIFRSISRPQPTLTFAAEMPRAVGNWTSQSTPWENPFFSGASPNFTYGRNLLVTDDTDTDSLGGPLAAAPEPATWIGAALALAVIGFTQRRRLRGLIARNV